MWAEEASQHRESVHHDPLRQGSNLFCGTDMPCIIAAKDASWACAERAKTCVVPEQRADAARAARAARAAHLFGAVKNMFVVL